MLHDELPHHGRAKASIFPLPVPGEFGLQNDLMSAGLTHQHVITWKRVGKAHHLVKRIKTRAISSGVGGREGPCPLRGPRVPTGVWGGCRTPGAHRTLVISEGKETSGKKTFAEIGH